MSDEASELQRLREENARLRESNRMLLLQQTEKDERISQLSDQVTSLKIELARKQNLSPESDLSARGAAYSEADSRRRHQRRISTKLDKRLSDRPSLADLKAVGIYKTPSQVGEELKKKRRVSRVLDNILNPRSRATLVDLTEQGITEESLSLPTAAEVAGFLSDSAKGASEEYESEEHKGDDDKEEEESSLLEYRWTGLLIDTNKLSFQELCERAEWQLSQRRRVSDLMRNGLMLGDPRLRYRMYTYRRCKELRSVLKNLRNFFRYRLRSHDAFREYLTHANILPRETLKARQLHKRRLSRQLERDLIHRPTMDEINSQLGLDATAADAAEFGLLLQSFFMGSSQAMAEAIAQQRSYEAAMAASSYRNGSSVVVSTDRSGHSTVQVRSAAVGLRSSSSHSGANADDDDGLSDLEDEAGGRRRSNTSMEALLDHLYERVGQLESKLELSERLKSENEEKSNELIAQKDRELRRREAYIEAVSELMERRHGVMLPSMETWKRDLRGRISRHIVERPSVDELKMKNIIPSKLSQMERKRASSHVQSALSKQSSLEKDQRLEVLRKKGIYKERIELPTFKEALPTSPSVEDIVVGGLGSPVKPTAAIPIIIEQPENEDEPLDELSRVAPLFDADSAAMLARGFSGNFEFDVYGSMNEGNPGTTILTQEVSRLGGTVSRLTVERNQMAGEIALLKKELKQAQRVEDSDYQTRLQRQSMFEEDLLSLVVKEMETDVKSGPQVESLAGALGLDATFSSDDEVRDVDVNYDSSTELDDDDGDGDARDEVDDADGDEDHGGWIASSPTARVEQLELELSKKESDITDLKRRLKRSNTANSVRGERRKQSIPLATENDDESSEEMRTLLCDESRESYMMIRNLVDWFHTLPLQFPDEFHVSMTDDRVKELSESMHGRRELRDHGKTVVEYLKSALRLEIRSTKYVRRRSKFGGRSSTAHSRQSSTLSISAEAAAAALITAEPARSDEKSRERLSELEEMVNTLKNDKCEVLRVMHVEIERLRAELRSIGIMQGRDKDCSKQPGYFGWITQSILGT